MKKVGQTQWEEVARGLFGDDREAWRFQCPMCGHTASIERAKREWPELKDRGWQPYAECVGRYLEEVGCDWAAYGLFRGPLFIEPTDGSKTIAAFDFDQKAYTEAGVEPLNAGGRL